MKRNHLVVVFLSVFFGGRGADEAEPPGCCCFSLSFLSVFFLGGGGRVAGYL